MDNIKQKRQELKLTQKELAADMGLSKKNGDVYVRKVENGRTEPSGLFLRCFQLLYERNLKEEQFFRDAFERLREEFKKS